MNNNHNTSIHYEPHRIKQRIFSLGNIMENEILQLLDHPFPHQE